MSKFWAVRVQYSDGNYTIRIPNKCVYCGGPPEKISIISTNYNKERHMFTRKWEIPYCQKDLALQKDCRRKLKMPWLFTFLVLAFALLLAPFTIGFGNSLSSGLGFVLTGLLGYLSGSFARLLIKKERIRNNPQLKDMFKDAYLGIEIRSYSNAADFAFTNEDVAIEFTMLNHERVVM